MALLATAHRQLGPGLADMVRQSVKPALMATLEEAFAANPLQQARRRLHETYHQISPCRCSCSWCVRQSVKPALMATLQEVCAADLLQQACCWL